MAFPPQAAAPAPDAGQDAPAPEAAPQQGKGASQIVTAVHTGLMQLMDLMQKNPALAEEAKALGAVVSGFQQVIESLGQAPGAQPAGAPPEAGGPGAPEAGGNPNARPM